MSRRTGSRIRLEHPVRPAEILRQVQVRMNRWIGGGINVLEGTVAGTADGCQARIRAAGVVGSFVGVAHDFEVPMGMTRIVGVAQRHGRERNPVPFLVETIALYVILTQSSAAGACAAI